MKTTKLNMLEPGIIMLKLVSFFIILMAGAFLLNHKTRYSSPLGKGLMNVVWNFIIIFYEMNQRIGDINIEMGAKDISSNIKV